MVSALRKLGHDVQPLGVKSDLGVIHSAIENWKPHIAFNLLEEFDGTAVYDQHVVSYRAAADALYRLQSSWSYAGTGQGPDKEGSLVPSHSVSRIHGGAGGTSSQTAKIAEISLDGEVVSEEASLGISQASIVDDDNKLKDRVAFIHASVGTGALIERYIEGREFYVGVIGNGQLQVLPVWELIMDKLPEDAKRIATERVKWSRKYQDKYGITSREARNLPEGKAEEIQDLAKRVYRALGLSGYARIDLRMDEQDQLYVLEANPNPQIAHNEDFADSAQKGSYHYKELIQELLNAGLRWRSAKAA